MREQPPAPLVDLLERLHLATPAEVRTVYGRARRLARDLPLFTSVWVDALAQSRLITPFQASELNAGRGETLGVGPFVLLDRLESGGYAENFRARHKTSGRVVRLILPQTCQRQPADIAARLERIVEKSPLADHRNLALLDSAGTDGDHVWASCPLVEGTSAREWMIQNGRFPAELALEIARQMAAAMLALERHERIHGDPHCRDLVIMLEGRVVLSAPGLRAAVRPEEGFSHADLPPEAFDYLAPERITLGTPPTVQSDLYASGYVWWHLLTGRPPFPGGNSLIKLRAVESGKVMKIAELAPDAPAPLIAAIGACTRRDPSRRPGSFAQVAETLGAPTREGRRALAKLIADGPRAIRRRPRPRPSLVPPRLVAASAALAVVSLVALASWRYLGGPTVTRGDVAPSGEGGAAQVAHEMRDRSHWPPGSQGRHTPPPGEGRKNDAAAGTAEHAIYRPRQGSGAVVGATTSLPNSPPGRASDDEWAGTGRGHRNTPSERGGEMIVLASDRAVRWDEIVLRKGAVVGPLDGKRASVVVPFDGLPVDVEGVRFERIDFVRFEASPDDAAAKPRRANGDQGAFIHLQAHRAGFDACTFDTVAAQETPSVAIFWDTRERAAGDVTALPTGVLKMTNCAFRGVAAGIECRTAGALVLEVDNLLFLGPGPLMRMSRAPSIEEPVVLSLRRTTLRGASAILECRYADIDDEPGNISIRSRDCAFAPSQGGALLVFRGKPNPAALVSALHWAGQGSLMTPEAAVVHWQAKDDQTHELAEEGLDVAGLVRNEVGFAGEVDAGVAASRVVRWQVPLRSPEPPGVGELQFELPSLRR